VTRRRVSSPAPFIYPKGANSKAVGSRAPSVDRPPERTRADWRADFSRPLAPRVAELPRPVEERCIAFLRHMGLAFGRIDLVVTPEDEHVFLEVNEMGQLLWVEAGEPAFPLLRAFSTFLVARELTRDSKLLGDDALSFSAFRASGAFEIGTRRDLERHATFTAPGIGIEP